MSDGVSPADLCGSTSRAHPAAKGCHRQLPPCTYLPYLLSGLLLSITVSPSSHRLWQCTSLLPCTQLPSSAQERRADCTSRSPDSTRGAYIKKLSFFLTKHCKERHSLSKKADLLATSKAELATRQS